LSTLKKPILYISVVVLIALYALSIRFVYKYYYPDLNPESVKFFITDKERVSDQDNVAFAIIGLNAPPETENIHLFGLNLVNQALLRYSDGDGKHMSLDASLPKIENELKLNADMGRLNCWVNRTVQDSENCYSSDELADVVSNNKILLDRHEELKAYRKYSPFVMFSRNGQLLINVHKLYLADIRHSLSSGGGPEAFNALIKDMQYRKMILSQPGTWIDKAISLVMYGLSFNQFEHAMTEYTDVVIGYDKGLIDSMSDLSMGDFNIDGVFREEFSMLNSALCVDEKLGLKTPDLCQTGFEDNDINVNYIMNSYYEKYIIYKHMTALDIDGLITRCELQPKFSKVDFYFGMAIHFPILTTYAPYKLFEAGSEKGCTMMIMFKLKIAKFRQSKVYLDVKRNKISEENINDYLQTTAERDYLTGLPFIYDETDKILRFPKEAPADKVAEFGMKI
jgi:hypothetical protein